MPDLQQPDNKDKGFLPITSSCVRDMDTMWKHVIKNKDYLVEQGYEELTIGPKNFQELLHFSLKRRAFKCLMVLLEYFSKNHESIEIEIDLSMLLAQALTKFNAPE